MTPRQQAQVDKIRAIAASTKHACAIGLVGLFDDCGLLDGGRIELKDGASHWLTFGRTVEKDGEIRVDFPTIDHVIAASKFRSTIAANMQFVLAPIGNENWTPIAQSLIIFSGTTQTLQTWGNAAEEALRAALGNRYLRTMVGTADDPTQLAKLIDEIRSIPDDVGMQYVERISQIGAILYKGRLHIRLPIVLQAISTIRKSVTESEIRRYMNETGWDCNFQLNARRENGTMAALKMYRAPEGWSYAPEE